MVRASIQLMIGPNSTQKRGEGKEDQKGAKEDQNGSKKGAKREKKGNKKGTKRGQNIHQHHLTRTDQCATKILNTDF